MPYDIPIGRVDFDAPVIQYWDEVGKLQKFLRKGG